MGSQFAGHINISIIYPLGMYPARKFSLCCLSSRGYSNNDPK